MGYPLTFKVTTVTQLCPLLLLNYARYRYSVTMLLLEGTAVTFSVTVTWLYSVTVTFPVTVTVSVTPLPSNGVHHWPEETSQLWAENIKFAICAFDLNLMAS